VASDILLRLCKKLTHGKGSEEPQKKQSALANVWRKAAKAICKRETGDTWWILRWKTCTRRILWWKKVGQSGSCAERSGHKASRTLKAGDSYPEKISTRQLVRWKKLAWAVHSAENKALLRACAIERTWLLP